MHDDLTTTEKEQNQNRSKSSRKRRFFILFWSCTQQIYALHIHTQTQYKASTALALVEKQNMPPPAHEAISSFLLLLLLLPCVTPLPPVLWYAPFFSGGGYCSEAIGFLQSLMLENVTVHIEQVGCVCICVCVCMSISFYVVNFQFIPAH